MSASIVKYLICLWCIVVFSCKEPYEPLPVAADNHYLVVEGFINTNGTTSIRLSRTIRLADTARPRPEMGAFITIEGVNNTSFFLQETGNGIYSTSQVQLPDLSVCRLRIRTLNGKQYLSDEILVKPVSPIDSVHWERTAAGVTTYVSTHDASNQTRYYFWDYQEDWEFRSTHNSGLEYLNRQVVSRDPNINIYRCWQTTQSSRIITATSSHLSNDVIRRIPITHIPQNSWLLGVRYSVEVRQYPLTKEGYEFWENVRRNSEQLGTIFDPLPSQTTGNIKCLTEPEEPVIGFVSAGTTSVKRIFITHAEVFPWQLQVDCPTVFVTPDSIHFYFGEWGYVPAYMELTPRVGYVSSTKECIDCRFRGSNIKPSFWP